MKSLLLFCCLLAVAVVVAQKQPLNHQAYDSWQSVGQQLVTADGRYAAYAVGVQEGDGTLEIKALQGKWQRIVPRGYQASFSDDGHYLVCKIKPLFRETREAKIKKKSPAEMPKDSLAIVLLGTDSIRIVPAVKSYKMPEFGKGPWLAWLNEKPVASPAATPDSALRLQQILRTADSLYKVADSLRNKVTQARQEGLKALKPVTPAAKKESSAAEDGTELVLFRLTDGNELHFQQVTDYIFDRNGSALAIESKPLLLRRDLGKSSTDTVMRNFNEIKGLAFSATGDRLAFLAERDSSTKSQHKYYKIWQYSKGGDSAKLLAAKPLTGMLIFQPEYTPWYSKDGRRLFVGVCREWPVKDTSLVDFETARLDLWHYRDEYLQPQQLVQLTAEKNRSWLTLIDPVNGTETPLADDSCEVVVPAGKGDQLFALGTSNKAYRVRQQWTQDGSRDIYAVNLHDGSRRLVATGVRGNQGFISPGGKYISWYDMKGRRWMSYETATGVRRELSKSINHPLFDEEDDHPDDPPPYGFMGWQDDDRFAFVYDRFDVWKCDLSGVAAPLNFTAGDGRRANVTIRYEELDREHDGIPENKPMLFSLFSNTTKGYNWYSYAPGGNFGPDGRAAALPYSLVTAAVVLSPVKARDADNLIYQRQTPSSNDIYATTLPVAGDPAASVKLSSLNPQQAFYNWFTVELRQWKQFDGKMSEGLLYKPENFDPAKKYPVILYFYEKDAGRRYNYIEPAPVRASINIAYYTSNGYIVFDPDISYKTGQPGEDAYNAVVSAAKWLTKFPWVDSTKMGIQGHSWGGYQVAYLVTRTNMFAAAEAGAPVSNMTSAYGGIRWGTGISRQFQYERTQSRLGATLWENRDRYLKNSPLFRADRIKTPLLILHNDKDDAVPWYQGIELFTALKRLGRTTWLVNYNDELHGISERRNRKDWTIRMSQFFDHYLKGKPAPAWMERGIPAMKKGVDWGL
ncbi:S9 family peptidase [Flavihumibacter petaseus]|uniref:Peptidase S9 family protein n=1 Tax=Flavihumibacter petaseus NBRC 106054 TaxID=1220578 RepID=A0A0E9N366_9BACT|nr:prolyl oligopeptidase family serine peptidase [Flavihumibacter petaseus]GAO44274.1 peptidase S9 family protein [Flavihumibacter petaseus NBRC 106054]